MFYTKEFVSTYRIFDKTWYVYIKNIPAGDSTM